MLLVVTQREEGAVYLRMQRLDSAVHHFRETCDVGNIGHLNAVFAKRLRGAARRDYLDAEAGESFREFDDTGFIGNAYQRSFDPF